jgi:DNA replication protein DnaC
MVNKIKSFEQDLHEQCETLDNTICKNVCKVKEQNCTTCKYLREYWWGLKQSLIPEKVYVSNSLKPEAVDVESYEQLSFIRKNIVNFVDDGNNLYLYSDNICGNGKTSWTFKLLQTYLFNCGNPFFECKGLFINVPWFMMSSRNAISTKDPFFYEIVKLIEKVDIVVWDDIGACETKGFDYQNLLALISLRDVSKLSNIFTSNLSVPNLEKIFDYRFVSRVWDNSQLIRLNGNGRRGL